VARASQHDTNPRLHFKDSPGVRRREPSCATAAPRNRLDLSHCRMQIPQFAMADAKKPSAPVARAA
jgi:hypothetical protein